MADSSIDSEDFWLYDLFPGNPVVMHSEPEDGFDGAGSHNVVSAAYPLGTKVMVRNHSGVAGVDGWSVFIYGKLEAQDATYVLAARHICELHSDGVPYDFTNEVATSIDHGGTDYNVSPIVIALGAMTANYFGWWWSAGVCPEEHVSDLGGVYYTLNDVVIGNFSVCNLATPGTTAGEFGFDLPDRDQELIVGYALADDTA